MHRIAKATPAERASLFEASAAALGMSPAVVEKDFWVCLVLDCLFNKSMLGGFIVFKGGTSLSKCYGLIQRFSEDIDLILDWRVLGYAEDEPWEHRSNTAQERFKEGMLLRANAYLADEFSSELGKSISEAMGAEARICMASEDETVLFEYPRSYSEGGILDVVRLEVGPLAAWTPSTVVMIEPYVARAFPTQLGEMVFPVRAAMPKRTFWEKATILHQEANRPQFKAMPRRYSRHYYDLFRLSTSPVRDEALADVELLERVVAFKEKFYRTPWARLCEARPGSFRLVPPDFRMRELATDYAAMRRMLFGDVPGLGEIMESIAVLESQINECA